MNRNILFLILGVILVGAVVLMNSDLDLEKPEVVADIKPAVIYDMGGKFDKSFNEGVWNGVQKFTEETGVEVMEFEVTNETQR